MPEISRFEGMKICLYHFDHEPPHIHVYCNEGEVVLSIADFEFIRGSLRSAQRRTLLEWARKHQSELFRLWEAAQQGEELWRLPAAR